MKFGLEAATRSPQLAQQTNLREKMNTLPKLVKISKDE